MTGADAPTDTPALLPPDPSVSGWHWLQEPESWCKPEPVFWCADPGVWRGKGSARDAARIGVRYIAPADPDAAAEIARLREALTEAQRMLCRAHDRIHCLPRTSDTELAKSIDRAQGAARAVLKGAST